MKKVIKTIFSRLFIYVACNFLAFVGGFIIALPIYSLFLYKALLNSWANPVIYIAMLLSFMVSFYFVYFLKNKKYKNLYIRKSFEGHSIKEILKMHISKFAKYELPILFVISFLLSLVPSKILAKSGISVIFLSLTFFTEEVPLFIFQKTTFIYRFIGCILGDIFITVLYFVCLIIAYKRWDKTRLKKPNK